MIDFGALSDGRIDGQLDFREPYCNICLYLAIILIRETNILPLAYLFCLEHKLWPFMKFDSCFWWHIGGHLGSYLEFTTLDMTDVIIAYCDDLLILENLCNATNFIKLSALE